MEIPNFQKVDNYSTPVSCPPQGWNYKKNKHQFYEKLLFSQGYIFKGKIPSDLKGLGHEMDSIFVDMHE
jgi:hypothetical protein